MIDISHRLPRRSLLLAAAAALTGTGARAQAPAYPNRPVRLITPFPVAAAPKAWRAWSVTSWLAPGASP